jgi:HD-GYP domain-containing protein (c-di-GMP phosphodiesterase class II)
MGEYYGCGDEECTKLYLAGALHDIGKLAISNKILEKPGRLTNEEYEVMKEHALYTWKILNEIDGLDEIVNWASFHHEKLNGRGYPFGKKDFELNRNERLLCCIDIYQALTEARPYKPGRSHEDTMVIMRDMAINGEIDSDITEDINKCYRQTMFA